ncbi:MAG: HEAT repeat domain-containing protein [bacterium]|nr:HEAT repeat domain-containing protein [bacterium]
MADSLEWDIERRLAAAKNPLTAAAVLATLADDSDLVVCTAVAGNPSTPESVRVAAAKGWLTPPAVLLAMADDTSWLVRDEAAHNPRTPDYVRDALERVGGDPTSGWHRFERLAAAESPGTSRRALWALSTAYGFDDEAQGVAGNPNTPSEMLAKLAVDPRQKVRSGVARNESTPGWLMASLARDTAWEVREEVARNWNSPDYVLTQLAEDHPAIPADGNTDWGLISERIEKDIENRGIRAAVASNPATPVHVLVRLSDDPESLVRTMVAANLNTPVDVVVALALNPDNSKRVRAGAAHNPNTPPDVLEQLAASAEPRARPGAPGATLDLISNWEVCSELADNPATPADVLARLAGDSDALIRRSVAKNSNTYPDLVEQLAQDPDQGVRSSAAHLLGNRFRIALDAPAAMLIPLAASPHPHVRRETAKHPNTPADVVARLAQDPHPDVRHAAKHPNHHQTVTEPTRGTRNEQLAAAEDPATSADTLNTLARRASWWLVRWAIARNPNTGGDTLEGLAHDRQDAVRWAASQHPNTPPDVLTQLAEDAHPDVRSGAARNPNTPADRLARLADEETPPPGQFSVPAVMLALADNPNTPADALTRLANNPETSVRQSVATNPNTPTDVLARLARNDHIPEVRSRAVRNPNIPADLLVRLTGDPDPYIRRLAASEVAGKGAFFGHPGNLPDTSAAPDNPETLPGFRTKRSSSKPGMMMGRLVANLKRLPRKGRSSRR